jgi:hypothetical protein
MSDSYHVTSAHFKGLSKRELNEMAEDPQSLLHQWSDKSAKKEAVRKERKSKKKKY